MAERKELGYAEDERCGSCEWGYASVVEQDGRFYVVEGSGCSCNGPELQEDPVVAGPAATLGGLFDELVVKGGYSDCVKDAFLDALRRLNDETMVATRKALGRE